MVAQYVRLNRTPTIPKLTDCSCCTLLKDKLGFIICLNAKVCCLKAVTKGDLNKQPSGCPPEFKLQNYTGFYLEIDQT